MVSEGARIKGSVLIARLRYVRGQCGSGGLAQLFERLSEPDREVLEGSLVGSLWYPMALGLRLDETIADLVAPQERHRVFLELGRASAELNLLEGQHVFLRRGDPHSLLRLAPQIYASYHAAGRRTYERLGEQAAMLRTFDAEIASAADCLTVIGWHQRAIELWGGKGARVEEVLCRANGAPHCEYRCSWTLGTPARTVAGSQAR